MLPVEVELDDVVDALVVVLVVVDVLEVEEESRGVLVAA